MGSDPKRLHNPHEKAQVVKSLEHSELERLKPTLSHLYCSGWVQFDLVIMQMYLSIVNEDDPNRNMITKMIDQMAKQTNFDFVDRELIT